jgi:hypothetical protein
MVRCAWLAVATTLIACSGCSNKGGNCNAGACGGNIVGSWMITGSCSNPATATGMGTTCPGETVQVNSSTAEGTLTFSADMTYTASITVSAFETETVPLSCLSGSGVAETCDELAMVFNEGLFGDAGTSSATCMTLGSNCDCNISLSIPATGTGTYSVSGDSFATMSQNGVGSGTYCVAGDTLTIITSPDGGSMTGTGGSGDLVATRQ